MDRFRTYIANDKSPKPFIFETHQTPSRVAMGLASSIAIAIARLIVIIIAIAIAIVSLGLNQVDEARLKCRKALKQLRDDFCWERQLFNRMSHINSMSQTSVQ